MSDRGNCFFWYFVFILKLLARQNLPSRFRSSYQRCFFKKGVIRNFAKFTGKHLCQKPFSLFYGKKEKRNEKISLQFGRLLLSFKSLFLNLPLVLNFSIQLSVMESIAILHYYNWWYLPPCSLVPCFKDF